MFLALISLNIGCKKIFPEQVNPQNLVQEESEKIDWQTPDTFPLFDSCDEMSAPELQYDCFTSTYAQNLHHYLQGGFSLYNRFKDTLNITLLVDTLGIVHIENVRHTRFDRVLDSLVRQPENYLTKVYPARKRNIPVNTQVQLSVVLNVE